MESGNQQGRPLGLEFVAGIAVGEGCFYISVSKVKSTKNKNGMVVTPGFRLFMDDWETIDIAAEILASNGLPVYVNSNRRGKGIHVTGLRRMSRYTETLIPFLTGQKLRAAILIQRFCASRLAKNQREPYGEDELAIIEAVRANNAIKGKARNPIGTLRD
jgi:hypothetical protein